MILKISYDYKVAGEDTKTNKKIPHLGYCKASQETVFWKLIISFFNN